MRAIVNAVSSKNAVCNRMFASKSTSNSKLWIERQRRDPFVQRARVNSYRCRSAFKLLQLNGMVPGMLIHPSDCVVDCGAAPGSWSQVAVELSKTAGSPSGLVVSLDLEDFVPVHGSICIPKMDIRETAEATRQVWKAVADYGFREFGGFDVVLSDIAPSASGLTNLDHPNLIFLAKAVLQFALHVSKPGSTLLVKLWMCPEVEEFVKLVERFFVGPWDPKCPFSSAPFIRLLKPPASRKDSAEIYICARGFCLKKP